MFAHASTQKKGTHVVTTSMKCVDPHATMNSAKPTTKNAQSRGDHPLGLARQVEQRKTDRRVGKERDSVRDGHRPYQTRVLPPADRVRHQRERRRHPARTLFGKISGALAMHHTRENPGKLCTVRCTPGAQICSVSSGISRLNHSSHEILCDRCNPHPTEAVSSQCVPSHFPGPASHVSSEVER